MKILHITNFARREVVDGGTNREEALAAFLAGRGAARLIVQDSGFAKSKACRLVRLPRLMHEVRSADPEVVVLNYPAYPFFWQHRVTGYYATAIMFGRWLASYGRRSGCRVVVDVADLPLFQYEDLGLPMHMSKRALALLDRTALQRADHVLVCSHSLSRLAAKAYGLDENAVIPVVNGSSAVVDVDPANDRANAGVRFVYCGHLSQHRGIGDLVQAFVQARIPDATLHLCGAEGEWIPSQLKAEDVVYHGSLTDREAAELCRSCDIGLIYYPQKGYYHLAFATKLALYVNNRLPVLCTDVKETGDAVKRLGVGQVADIGRFSEAMRGIAASRGELIRYREPLREAAKTLTWDHLYSEAFGRIGL